MWCVGKHPLILGADLSKMTCLDCGTNPALAQAKILSILSNKELIAVNQDSMGIPATPLLRHHPGKADVRGDFESICTDTNNDNDASRVLLWRGPLAPVSSSSSSSPGSAGGDTGGDTGGGTGGGKGLGTNGTHDYVLMLLNPYEIDCGKATVNLTIALDEAAVHGDTFHCRDITTSNGVSNGVSNGGNGGCPPGGASLSLSVSLSLGATVGKYKLN